MKSAFLFQESFTNATTRIKVLKKKRHFSCPKRKHYSKMLRLHPVIVKKNKNKKNDERYLVEIFVQSIQIQSQLSRCDKLYNECFRYQLWMYRQTGIGAKPILVNGSVTNSGKCCCVKNIFFVRNNQNFYWCQKPRIELELIGCKLYFFVYCTTSVLKSVSWNE